MENNLTHTQWTNEAILDLVRKLRNDLIKDFLDERHLKEYCSYHFNIREMDNAKIEFIKKDLKELLISPVDTYHYKPIIDHIKLSESAALAEGNEQLFYREIESILKKNAY